MLSLTVVLEIRRLLDQGELSQREIAEKLRVARGTVSAVANGRRWVRDRLAGRRDGHSPLPERCPSCGGMVFLPCRLCQTRAYRQRQEFMRQLTRATPRRPQRDPRRAA